MIRILLFYSLLLLPLFEAGAVVVVTYRGDDPNIFPVAPPNAASGSLDINDDGVDDFLFWRDAGLVVGMQAHGTNRFISTLSTGSDVGGNISPVYYGSILGPDTVSLGGDWHHHTDNRGSSGFGLFTMQSEDAYIGVEFDIDGNTHYGWIQYTGFYVAEFTFISPDGPVTVIGADVLGGFINSWGYETEPGVPIVVGIPEPSTYSLILLIGLAVIGRRTRKQQGPTRRSRATDGADVFSER
jgi:hypothetical protein